MKIYLLCCLVAFSLFNGLAYANVTPSGLVAPDGDYITNCPWTSVPSTAVASDGSVSTNTQWENQKTKYWYIELQRYGTNYIETGINNEDPSLISRGIQILNWGWEHQIANGDFNKTGSNPTMVGGDFLTVSLFFESAARATLDLQRYHPSTYTLSSATYADTISSFKSHLALTASYLTNPTIQTVGNSIDQVYTHRYYLLAAGLQQTSALLNDPSLATQASTYIINALARQMPQNELASLTAPVNGIIPPATLYISGQTVPPGTVQSISAFGVNPERGGFDISYQMVGLLFACYWYNNATDPVLKNEVKTMLTNGLSWERSREDNFGNVNTNGSTRIGVDETQDGAGVKTIATSTVIAAWQAGSQIDVKGRDWLGAVRLASTFVQVTSDTVSVDGAINNNTPNSYNISDQDDGVDFVEAGIHRENETLIVQGLNIIEWGWAQQAEDGSFPLTHSPYTDTAAFWEAATRVVLDLQNYHPISHTLPANYAAEIATYISKISLTGRYLQNPVLISKYAGATSSRRTFVNAAGFQEAFLLTGDATFQTTGQAFLSAALKMQLSDGTNPESGAFNVNSQGFSTLYALRYLRASTNTYNNQLITAEVENAMRKEKSVVNIAGDISGSTPATTTIDSAFFNAFVATGDATFLVESNRINGLSL